MLIFHYARSKSNLRRVKMLINIALEVEPGGRVCNWPQGVQRLKRGSEHGTVSGRVPAGPWKAAGRPGVGLGAPGVLLGGPRGEP